MTADLEDPSPLLESPTLSALADAVGAAAMPHLLQGFLDDLEERAAVLPTITGEALLRELHALKSTAGTFGAKRLFEAAQQLDDAVHAADDGNIARGVSYTMDVLRSTRSVYVALADSTVA